MVKCSFLVLINVLLLSFAQAQTTLVPQPGYTYKVDAGVAGKQVYISGQRPFNAKGELVGAGDLSAQARQVFENLKTALGKVGMSLRDVRQVTYHIKGIEGQVDAQASQQVNNVGTAYFTQGAPKIADIKSIPKIVRDDVLIEVEVVAVKE
ncbi:RidA family protein [Spirosoma taeanense]|uniref:RidA family protein n=1 Tax=Spirosoma taeanense TaxID=2735870 RepID=A0A6M5YB97_9BACT|nr:RidA family protein [Spirosoma taeanense]QJW90511.1 RidA family protein [Spirosoma taeanense]